MSEHESNGSTILWVAALVVIGIVALWWHVQTTPKSPAVEAANCTVDAGKEYDSEQAIIAKSTYPNEATRDYYYQQSSNGYSTALAGCNKLSKQ